MSKFFAVCTAALGAWLVASALAWWLLTGVADAAVPTVAAPTISGTARQGSVLTVTNGAVTPPAATITDQWEVCTPVCAAIAGQTGATYTVATTDVGHTIVVVETATDPTSPAPNSASATSAPTATVLPLPPANTAPPTIAGTAQQGQMLTASPGTWSNNPTVYAYQWNSCTGTVCTAITGAVGASYLVPATEVGKILEVSVTASNAGGPAAAPAVSAPTAAVLPAAPVNTVLPSISGTAQQGQTLTLAPGAWINTPTSITDQWWECTGFGCGPIPGQTGTTYSLGPADVGHTIEVVETATNAGAPLGGTSATSAATAVITATSSTSLFPISSSAPTTNQTVALVATVSSGSGNAAPSGSMSFFDGPNGIPGCTGKGVKGGVTVTVVCQASFPAGTAQISAAYAPGVGSLVAGSISPPTSLAVGRDATSVSLAVTKQVLLGSPAMYSATLVLPASNSGPVQPTGSIEFLDRGQPIGTCVSQSLINLTASCTLKYTVVGSHDVSATYSGDSNFMPSTSTSAAVQVATAPTAPPVLGFVRSTFQWTFYYHPTYTQVILLKAFRVLAGTTVVVTCHGSGCPWHKMRSFRKHSGSLNLSRAFRNRQLRTGATITIRLTHPHWVGKYYSFKIRAGRPPSIDLSCLAVGKATPGVGC
jgi:hypothetical protein